MKKHLALTLFLTAQIFLFTTCKTNVDVIMDDYNENFIPGPGVNVQTGPCPGDDDFTEDIMLDKEYLIWSDAVLSISAPNKCGSYSWIITDPEDKDETPILIHHFGDQPGNFYDVWNQQTFCINIPDSGLQINKVYKISLTVVAGEEGHTYKDVAALVIYQHLLL